MRSTVYFSSILVCLLWLGGCHDDSDSAPPRPPAEVTPNPYAAAELWMCKPGAASNRCLELDQTITYIYSDTSQAVFEHTLAVDPDFDCFYVYPTVDLNEEPGNTEDLADDEPALAALYNQAARFTELCNMYAPLYHQMTNGTYDLGDYRSTEYYEIAFNDVNDAFGQYLRESGSRPFVLLGHSQGSHMLLELLEKRFEDDPKLRQRLISALIIGPLGRLIRPEGAILPDSFDNIPLCTHATQTGCTITYDTIDAGGLEERVADSRTCVNPTLLGGNPGVLENTIWKTDGTLQFPGIETLWAGYPALHTASCEPDGFLAIDTLDDERMTPASPQFLQAVIAGDTLHITDVNWAIGDLLRIVSTQAESMP
ncbi:MAG: DUF3089 domain-containing protein [Halioglobus sp.]